MKINNIISIIFALSIILSFVSCTDASLLYDYSYAKSLSTTEREEIEKHIDSIRPKLILTHTHYEESPEDCDKLLEIGIKGIPVLLDAVYKVEQNEEYWDTIYHVAGAVTYKSFLMLGFLGITRVDLENYEFYYCEDNHSYDSKSAIICFWEYSKEQIPIILKSKSDISEKCKELRMFGIFAIPYIIREIDKGNDEYKEFFIQIGLHISNSEFLEIVSFNGNLPNQWDNVRTADGAEDFDYKQWLSENQEDLDAMFKFLDEYTKE